MTFVLERDLREVIETIWSVTLGLELVSPNGSIPPAAHEVMCGFIQVSGAWSGTITVTMGERLARRAAAAMFDQAAESLGPAELQDALGEITNMTGGSVKALLPGPSHLSLPSVVSGTDFAVSAPGAVVTSDVTFQVRGSQIRVRVLERRRAPGEAEALSA
ncbi:MAG TPA: chemotaxis protein CheX [Polyangiaceae bacterium]|nr:chemotaxis protein CheX [Polyangiaceae bacterium]